MEAPATSRHLAALEQMLGLERQLLETLQFKLTQAKLVLTANESRFVAPALREVQAAMEDIRTAEDERMKATAAIAADWGVHSKSLTRAYLADHAPEPYGARFRDHRYAFMDLTSEIERLSADNQRLATANLDVIKGTLDLLYDVTEQSDTYDAKGHRSDAARGPLRLDRSL